MTKRLRKVVNLKKIVERELGRTINIRTLYALVGKHDLKKYLEAEDSTDEPSVKLVYPVFEPYELIQIDGAWIRYFKIADGNGGHYSPVVITALDTGSRYILCSMIFQSESLGAAADC